MPDVPTLLIAEPVITVAHVVFGLVGFGSTLVSAPLLAHLLPVSTVAPTLALTDMIASWFNGWHLSQHVARHELVRLVPALFAGSALGAWLLFTLPVKLLMPLLGAFVVLYALNGLRRSRRAGPGGTATSAACSARCSAPAAGSTRSTCCAG